MANDTHGFYMGNDKTVFSSDGNTITHNGIKYLRTDNANLVGFTYVNFASDSNSVMLSIDTNKSILKNLKLLDGKYISIFADYTEQNNDGDLSGQYVLTDFFKFDISKANTTLDLGTKDTVKYDSANDQIILYENNIDWDLEADEVSRNAVIYYYIK